MTYNDPTGVNAAGWSADPAIPDSVNAVEGPLTEIEGYLAGARKDRESAMTSYYEAVGTGASYETLDRLDQVVNDCEAEVEYYLNLLTRGD